MTTAPINERSDGTWADLQREVLGAFCGPIEPVRLPLAYRCGILLVAVVMVILPLVYVGLTGLVAYGVYFYMTHATGILEVGRGRGRLLAVVVYFAPLVIGGILVLFMFKPLLSRRAKQRKPQSLSRDEEPLLFAFVDRVCQAVRAPRPRRIDIDCQVNASAAFRRGLWSMLGNDLVLTIGLPLVAGLSMRQFAGVLAHEFGHFAQGAGMRLTYVIRTISFWFTRVVYERDEWDERLIHWAEEIDLRFGWVFYVARFFVWLTRRVLWLLMMVGHAVSGFMLRQMEFDADRHEARLAGSDAFEATARRLMVLNVGNRGALSDLGDFYREGRLGDNLPKLILHNVGQLTPDTCGKINQLVDESKTGWLDTHPGDKDRIASARRENARGIFQVERPATELFRDFDALAKTVTWEFYRDVFEEKLRRTELRPIDELLARQDQEQNAFKALRRFFQATYSPVRPMQLPTRSGDSASSAEEASALVQHSRQEMLAALPAYQQAFDRFLKAPLDKEAALEPELTPFESLAGQRLFAAIRLLRQDSLAALIAETTSWREESDRLVQTLQVLDRQIGAVRDLQGCNAVLAHLLQRLSEGRREDGLIAAVRGEMERTRQAMLRLREALETHDYPFDHARGRISIGEFAVPEIPDRDSPGDIYSATDHLTSSLHHLRARVVGRLCIFAEQIEAAIGLPPLPEPLDEQQPALQA